MNKRFALTASLGCALLIFLAVVGISLLLAPVQLMAIVGRDAEVAAPPTLTQMPAISKTQTAIPTLTPVGTESELALQAGESPQAGATAPPLAGAPASLAALYERLNPGVVNIQVFVEQAGISGQGAGSGFILDDEGHIITNNHVVAEAEQITVIFYNELEAQAELIGTDADSDLAVIKVDSLPEGTRPLALGDSTQVQAGEWVVAIGNPFGQQSSISVGIVSAVGRTIPAGETPFVIPQAIQTDAAINPGNSGGPLLNRYGQVIGVNAQIASGSARANSGVGFAVPINIARRVVPALIERGSYEWPWLGVQGGSVNLAIMQANNLDTQRGAYIDQVIPNGPADKAGLEGSSGTEFLDGVEVPVGGDIVVAAEGEQVTDFGDLLVKVAERNPGDELEVTVLRDGQRQQMTLQLIARPSPEAP